MNAEAQQLSLLIKHGGAIEGFGLLAGWNPEKPLKGYQEQGVLWLYYTARALLNDTMGTGKTAHALGLIQLLLAREEAQRVLVVVPAATAHGSWMKDGFADFVKDMPYAFAGTGVTKANRRKVYSDPTWRVLLTNYEMFWRDEEELLALGFDVIICDEADVLRNKENRAWQSMMKLAQLAMRVVLMTGTPINNKLVDLYALLEILGLTWLVGSEDQFKENYVDYVFDEVRIKPTRGPVIKKKIPRVVGHRNLDHLKALLDPYMLRRTKADIPDSSMPDLEPLTFQLELTPQQAKLYQDLLYTASEARRRDDIENVYMRLRQCCLSTALVDQTLGDHSSKMDRLVHQLTGDWRDEKMVVFAYWKDGLDLFAKRLDAVGIGHVTLTSDVKHAKRENLRQDFIHDPGCRILMGTTAIEAGLNLQNCRLQANLDLLPNPKRHEQLAGRIVRQGSEFDIAYVLSMLAVMPGGGETVDGHTMRTMAKKAAVAAYMLGDASTLSLDFISALTDAELRRVCGLPG